MNSIFISHASRDADFALKLAGDLRKRGHEALTYADLEAEGKRDSDLDKRLAGVIASSSYFVPVITPAVQERSWFKQEITTALREEAPQGRVMILPALKEPCVLPEPLGVRSPVDFSKSYPEGLHNLCDRLSAPPPELKSKHPGLESLKRQVMDALWHNRTKLQRLSPERFVNAVAEIFGVLGYEVELTQFVRDGGVDLVAVGGSDKSKKRFLMQCKRYAPANRFAVELVKSARPIHIDPQDGQAHVVTTCSFLAPQGSGEASERLTSSRWKISSEEWESVRTWIAPFIEVEPPMDDIDRARDRYAELVDKKFGSYLTEPEQAELLRLRTYLDEAESGFYEPIKKRIDLALAKLNSSVEG
jgi:hypothetical protein